MSFGSVDDGCAMADDDDDDVREGECSLLLFVRVIRVRI